MYQTILVPLDGSVLAESALKHLPHLVGTETEIILLRVVDVTVPAVPAATASESMPAPALGARQPGVVSSEAQAKTFDDAESYLQAKAATVHPHGRAVRSLVVGDTNPAMAITTTADNEAADLIVMATHGRSGVVRWVLGSVAERVLHATHRPLLLIRPGPPVG